MKDQLTDEQIAEVLKALNDAIDKGPWDKSNFLKAIGKNITHIRDNFVEKVGIKPNIKQEQAIARQKVIASGEQQEIYISLYSANGSDMTTWERIVTNLPKQMISRPIYGVEQELVNAIKQKENKVNEAYVAILIAKSNILALHEDKTTRDKNGVELLNLKDKSLLLENITRFVHISGIYQLEKNRLVKD